MGFSSTADAVEGAAAGVNGMKSQSVASESQVPSKNHPWRAAFSVKRIVATERDGKLEGPLIRGNVTARACDDAIAVSVNHFSRQSKRSNSRKKRHPFSLPWSQRRIATMSEDERQPRKPSAVPR